MKKKIVFFMANLHGGGAERVTTNIIRQLDPDLFDITLLMVKKEGEFLKDIPSYVKITDLQVKKTILSIFKLRDFIKQYEPDIVYSTMFHTSIALTLALLGIKKKPYTVLRNPTSPKLLITEDNLPFLWRILLELSYRKANKILAQTPEMKEEIIEYHHINKDKIEVFLNPLDTKNIDQKIKNKNNPFNAAKINVVAAGRLTEAKAFDTLLYAFQKVVQKDNRFMLHIIGKDDGEEKNLLKLRDELGLSEYVSFLGFQENPYRFFYFSQLYVLSSRREGLPNTVLENLYLKKPIIATECIPFMNKLIHDGKNGYIVSVDDITSLSNAILNYKDLLPISEEVSIAGTLTLFNDVLEDV